MHVAVYLSQFAFCRLSRSAAAAAEQFVAAACCYLSQLQCFACCHWHVHCTWLVVVVDSFFQSSFASFDCSLR